MKVITLLKDKEYIIYGRDLPLVIIPTCCFNTGWRIKRLEGIKLPIGVNHIEAYTPFVFYPPWNDANNYKIRPNQKYFLLISGVLKYGPLHMIKSCR
jgi:hypothetical protein